jgi:putative PIG3 family NAD(P)H quinone oxidoreductase
VLKPGTRPLPLPGAGEVLIKIAAAGINRPDVMQRQGSYPPPAGASDIPGLEIAGTVAAVGLGVNHTKVGDQVCALVTGGGYAAYCIAPEPQCLPVPKGFSMVEAAALPETCFTVWTNLFERGALKPGETVLVHGGSSGIGTTAIQLAKAVDARVIATAGSPEKVARCRELGADDAIDYRNEDFVARVEQITGGHGADVILDVMGAAYLDRNLDALATRGRLVVVGLQGGTRAELDLSKLMRKRGAIIATNLRPRPVAEKGAIVASVREHVWPLIEDGRVTVVSDARFPMAQAADAHRLLESSGHVGKVLLVAHP